VHSWNWTSVSIWLQIKTLVNQLKNSTLRYIFTRSCLLTLSGMLAIDGGVSNFAPSHSFSTTKVIELGFRWRFFSEECWFPRSWLPMQSLQAGEKSNTTKFFSSKRKMIYVLIIILNISILDQNSLDYDYDRKVETLQNTMTLKLKPTLMNFLILVTSCDCSTAPHLRLKRFKLPPPINMGLNNEMSLQRSAVPISFCRHFLLFFSLSLLVVVVVVFSIFTYFLFKFILVFLLCVRNSCVFQ